ncbi:hypothetical protein CRENBAI_013341 [Crenichthys baileyi]|uniref:Uncharacterized protein n=1 Tax=Crenichthys baileyi TaxID=28760 RepID=A0AAV9RTY9_9TELE
MCAVKMSPVQPQREMMNEQLTPAEETFTEFKGIIVKPEEELDGQRRLLDFSRIPLIILHRIDLSQYYVCKEEGVPTELSNQEGNSTLDQEGPEPLQIKQEQEELEHQQLKEEEEQLCIAQDENQLVLKQETDDILVILRMCKLSTLKQNRTGTNSSLRPPLIPQREMMNEQLTPAEETFTEFKGIIVKTEEELDGQRRLLDFSRIPPGSSYTE